jgi:hypothetical protein
MIFATSMKTTGWPSLSTPRPFYTTTGDTTNLGTGGITDGKVGKLAVPQILQREKVLIFDTHKLYYGNT